MWCCERQPGRWMGALLIAAVWMSGAAADESVDEILKRSQDVINEAEEIAGAEAAEMKARKPDVIEDRAWMDGRGVDLREDAVGENDTAQQRAWNAIMQEAQQAREDGGGGPPHPQLPDNALYVYISLSMPETALRELFQEALTNESLPPTIFLLRGWEPPNIGKTISRLNDLLPDRETLEELPNVQINPVLFRDNEIKVTPTFMTKRPSGKWASLEGSTSLADALEKISIGQYADRPFGPTYPIEEPDVLALIQERLSNMDWSKQVEKAKAGIFKPTTGQMLPEAEKDDSYLVDLTVGINQDLRGANNEVFAQAGETVNPFDYMTVQTRYVFFDANSAAQRKVAREWMQAHPYTRLISTLPVEDPEARKAMLSEMGQPVHEVNPALVQRFQLRQVPALAYQEGRMLRVDVHGMKQEK